MLSGYKTYLLAAGSLAYAVFGLYTGNLDWNAGMQIIQTALMGGTIRHGISTSKKDDDEDN
jgi:hypothetical protein